jgi:hypothetical protein
LILVQGKDMGLVSVYYAIIFHISGFFTLLYFLSLNSFYRFEEVLTFCFDIFSFPLWIIKSCCRHGSLCLQSLQLNFLILLTFLNLSRLFQTIESWNDNKWILTLLPEG